MYHPEKVPEREKVLVFGTGFIMKSRVELPSKAEVTGERREEAPKAPRGITVSGVGSRKTAPPFQSRILLKLDLMAPSCCAKIVTR